MMVLKILLTIYFSIIVLFNAVRVVTYLYKKVAKKNIYFLNENKIETFNSAILSSVFQFCLSLFILFVYLITANIL